MAIGTDGKMGLEKGYTAASERWYLLNLRAAQTAPAPPKPRMLKAQPQSV